MVQLRIDLPLFLYTILLLITLVYVGYEFAHDQRQRSFRLRSRHAFEELGCMVVVLFFPWIFFELITHFGWHVTLPFIAAVTPGSFPTLQQFLKQPHWIVGNIWLAYYFVVTIALLFPEEAPANTTQLPLSRAIQNGPHWTHVEHCYKMFREALAAWSPPPITRLKTPTTFEYYQGDGLLLWHGRTLILPEAMLANPQSLERRLPDLARELACYNYGDRWLRKWMALTPAKVPTFFMITGNFVWLPAIVHRQWVRWQIERTLQIDCFVHWASQGTALLRELRRKREENMQKGLADSSRPTLSERIDQLEMLVGIEQKQKENQGIRPKEQTAAATVLTGRAKSSTR